MITVKPLNDRDALAALYAQNGEAFSDTSMAVVAAQEDTVLGYCLFDLDAERIAIGKISPQNDLLLADGILRSALHVALNRRVIVAEYTDSAPKNLLDKLDFVKSAENRTLKIEKLFSSCQNCGQ